MSISFRREVEFRGDGEELKFFRFFRIWVFFLFIIILYRIWILLIKIKVLFFVFGLDLYGMTLFIS